MKACILILGTLFITVACNSHKTKLSKEKYTDIVLDLQVAERIINGSTAVNKDSLRLMIHRRISEIYGFKNVDDLKASLLPLETDPELMLEIIKIMSKKLDQLADSSLSEPVQ